MVFQRVACESEVGGKPTIKRVSLEFLFNRALLEFLHKFKANARNLPTSSIFTESFQRPCLDQQKGQLPLDWQLHMRRCCALRILEAQDDFANEVSLLETLIQQSGHGVIFYPKFHCELNYIEYYWAVLK